MTKVFLSLCGQNMTKDKLKRRAIYDWVEVISEEK